MDPYAMQAWGGGDTWQEAAPGAGGEHSNLYVGNLAPDVDDATLAEAFRSCGAVTSACVWRDTNTQQSMGFGLVNYASVADARRAIETLSGRPLCGQPLEVRFANAERGGVGGRGGPHPNGGPGGFDGAAGPPGEAGPSPNLYIKGLPPGTTEVGLRNVFAPFGVIVDSRVLYPQSTAPSALLRYTHTHEASAAIAAMHNVTPPGASNALQVRYAESPSDKQRRATAVAGRPGAPGELPGPRIPPPALPSGSEAVERVECPASLVGWLIGRGGETIKGLQTKSGSMISIDQNLPEGVPRVVLIAGTRDQATLGRQLVEELLASGAARGGGGTWPAGGAAGGPPGGGGGAPGGMHGGGMHGGAGMGGAPWGGPQKAAWAPPQHSQPFPGHPPQQQAMMGGPPGGARMPDGRAPAPAAPVREPEEEPEPEPPTFDAEAVAAARAAAAERAADLPPELRFVDAPLEQLAQVAVRRAGGRLARPAQPDAAARARCTAALRDLRALRNASATPSAALLDTLAALSPPDAPEWDAAADAGAPAEHDELDEQEEAAFALTATALAAHLAAPPEFARHAGGVPRSTALGAAGLAASALLCADERRAVRFFAAGGAAVLASVAGWTDAPACVRAAAVRALARATRFAAACAFVCDEWATGGVASLQPAPATGVARLLLAPQSAATARLATAVLVHCHVCALSWQLRAAAEGTSVADDQGGEEAHALAALLAEQRRLDVAAAEFAPREGDASPPAQPAAGAAATLWLLLDARALPSLAAAVARADGHAAARLREGAAALLRELAATRPGLYALAAEAQAAAALARALGGDSAALVRAALLGVTGVEALLRGDGEAVRLGALLSLTRVARDGAHRARAAALLAAPAALDCLCDLLAAPPPAAGAPPLMHSLAAELLLTLLSDAQPASLAAWAPHTGRLTQLLGAAEAQLAPASLAAARDWLAAGARWQERGWVGTMTWLSALVAEGGAPANGDAAAGNGDVTAAPGAASGGGGAAALSPSSHVATLCALRQLAAAVGASADTASALFGMGAFATVAPLLRRTAEVLGCGGVASPDDAAAMEEDMDAQPALGACRRCERAADVCVAAATLAAPVLEQLRVGGVAEYRAAAIVGALLAAHAAASVQHAAGGPAASGAHAARAACAAALSFWAMGPPAWKPRLLPTGLADAAATPRSALAAALLMGDVLPPAGSGARLEPGARAQLAADLAAAPLSALLQTAAASPSVRLHAAAVRALARCGALGAEHAACVAAACSQAVAAVGDAEPVRGRLLRVVKLLAGDCCVDAADQASVADALWARLGSNEAEDAAEEEAAAASDAAPPAASVEAQFSAAMEDALQAGEAALVSWRIPREGLRFADDAAKRKRILRAEVRAKRAKTHTPAPAPPPEPAPAPLPAARRKPAAGAGRTIHVDEFEARQAAARKGAMPPGVGAAADEPAAVVMAPPPPPPPAPVAPAPPPAPTAAPAPAKSMLSIKFGAQAPSAPAPSAAPLAAAAAAEPQLLQQPPPSRPAEVPPPAPPPSSYAPPAMIPGLGAYAAPPAAPAAIPGLGYAAVPPPAYAPAPPQLPPRHAVPPPAPPPGPPPAQQPAAAWGQQQQPSAAVLQQLSSPEAIAQLLADPARLRALLEQYPQLAAMLQAKLRGGPQ